MTDTITTELRESMVDDARGLLYIGETALANLCDAIDAVHANLEAENESLRRELDRVLGEQDGAAGFDALMDARDRGVNAVLREPASFGLMSLPKDMNGEYIHIDDVMEWPDHTGDPFEVIAIGNGTLYYVEDGEIQWTRAETKRHYHAPTVEDVLREFALEVCGEPALTIRSGVVEEYASRLRLAGES